MIKNIISPFLAVLFVVYHLSFFPVSADSTETANIENQISDVLKKVFNITQFSVSVREDEYTEVINVGKDSRNILPGVPVEEKFQGDSSKRLLRRSRLLITVIVDESVGLVLQRRISGVLKVSLNLNVDDKLEIISEKFVKPSNPLASSSGDGGPPTFKMILLAFFMKPANIMLTLAFILIFIFLFGPVRYSMKYIASYFANASAGPAGAGAAAQGEVGRAENQMPQQVNLLTASPESASSGKEVSKMPFSFINEKNISNLAFLLKDEDSEKIANIIGFLQDALIEKFLGNFPEEKQSDIMSFLIYKKELTKYDITEEEKSIRERIDYVSGGRERLLTMLENSKKEVQEQFLQHIADEDPILASELRGQIFHFEDIARQDVQVIQTVLRFINTRSLAQALQFTENEVKERIFSVISAGAKDIIQEELELLPENQSASLREQKNIVGVMRKLKDAGTIELK